MHVPIPSHSAHAPQRGTHEARHLARWHTHHIADTEPFVVFMELCKVFKFSLSLVVDRALAWCDRAWLVVVDSPTSV
jgi:hypothetical protein